MAQTHSTLPAIIVRNAMPRTLVQAVAIAHLLFGSAAAAAEVIDDPQLGLTLELPQGLVAFPEYRDSDPKLKYAFRMEDIKPGETAIGLSIEPLGGVIDPGRLPVERFPKEIAAKPLVATWQGFQLDGMEGTKTVEGSEFSVIIIQVPLKREAIQLVVFGPADRKSEVQRLLKMTLKGLKGETNWSSSPPTPEAVETVQTLNAILLVVLLLALIAWTIFLWVQSNRAPRGTVLALTILLFVLSSLASQSEHPLMVFPTAVLFLMGLLGGIVSILEMLRPRKRPRGRSTAKDVIPRTADDVVETPKPRSEE